MKFITLSIAIMLIAIVVFFLKDNSEEFETTKSAETSNIDVIVEASKKIQRRWIYGDFEETLRKKNTCINQIGSLKNIGGHYLRCNRDYLECFLNENSSFEVEYQSKNFKIMVNRVYKNKWNGKLQYTRIVSNNLSQTLHGIPYGVMLNLSIDGIQNWSMSIVLTDSCSDTYLPQRRYGYSVWKKESNNPFVLSGYSHNPDSIDWTWDNLRDDIYIDKFLVSNRDVKEWVLESNEDYNLNHFTNENLPKPATRLTMDQMKRFCAFRGKSLLDAHIYDAATFLPHNQKTQTPRVVFRGPYPWSIRRESFFKKNNLSDIDSEDCKKAYVWECIKKYSRNYYNGKDTSWIGIGDILGGNMEAMRNPIEPQKNLMASSEYFEIDSKWHELGLRATWNEIEFNDKAIDFGPDSNYMKEFSIPFEIGFRCMKYSEGEL